MGLSGLSVQANISSFLLIKVSVYVCLCVFVYVMLECIKFGFWSLQEDVFWKIRDFLSVRVCPWMFLYLLEPKIPNKYSPVVVIDEETLINWRSVIQLLLNCMSYSFFIGCFILDILSALFHAQLWKNVSGVTDIKFNMYVCVTAFSMEMSNGLLLPLIFPFLPLLPPPPFHCSLSPSLSHCSALDASCSEPAQTCCESSEVPCE